jgi:DcuC family C4-dicarboxylate transporter
MKVDGFVNDIRWSYNYSTIYFFVKRYDSRAVIPHANQFGLEIINMGSMASLGGALGRRMSPVTGATIICAGIAGVNPIEVIKRNTPGMILAMITAMFILL